MSDVFFCMKPYVNSHILLSVSNQSIAHILLSVGYQNVSYILLHSTVCIFKGVGRQALHGEGRVSESVADSIQYKESEWKIMYSSARDRIYIQRRGAAGPVR